MFVVIPREKSIISLVSDALVIMLRTFSTRNNNMQQFLWEWNMDPFVLVLIVHGRRRFLGYRICAMQPLFSKYDSSASQKAPTFARFLAWLLRDFVRCDRCRRLPCRREYVVQGYHVPQDIFSWLSLLGILLRQILRWQKCVMQDQRDTIASQYPICFVILATGFIRPLRYCPIREWHRRYAVRLTNRRKAEQRYG